MNKSTRERVDSLVKYGRQRLPLMNSPIKTKPVIRDERKYSNFVWTFCLLLNPNSNYEPRRSAKRPLALSIRPKIACENSIWPIEHHLLVGSSGPLTITRSRKNKKLGSLHTRRLTKQAATEESVSHAR